MPTKYERLVGDYCARHGITVPPGFARLTPSRYVIIRTHNTPPKLIAKTWFKTADVVYYIKHFLLPEVKNLPSLAASDWTRSQHFQSQMKPKRHDHRATLGAGRVPGSIAAS